MLYRRLTLDDMDREDLRELVRNGVGSRDVGMDVNMEKLEGFCRMVITGPLNYSAVAEEGGRCVAYIGGVTAEAVWYSRAQLNVVAWYSIRPFAGIRLLTDCLTWARSQVLITSAVLHFDPAMRERVCDILKRRGFAYHDIGAALIHV